MYWEETTPFGTHPKKSTNEVALNGTHWHFPVGKQDNLVPVSSKQVRDRYWAFHSDGYEFFACCFSPRGDFKGEDFVFPLCEEESWLVAIGLIGLGNVFKPIQEWVQVNPRRQRRRLYCTTRETIWRYCSYLSLCGNQIWMGMLFRRKSL